jgi:hypothetical protein
MVEETNTVEIHRKVCPSCRNDENLYTIEKVTILYSVAAFDRPTRRGETFALTGEEETADHSIGGTHLYYTDHSSHTIDEESNWPDELLLCRSCSWEGGPGQLVTVRACARCGDDIHQLDEFTWLSTADDSPNCAVEDGDVITHQPREE